MSIIDEYGGVKRAVPKISDYRERYKKKKLTIADIVAPPRRVKLKNRADEVKSQFPGMVFGPGLEEEF